MNTLDYAVIGLYMLAIAWISFLASKRHKNADDYFVAGRTMPGWAVGMALMTTIIGSGTIVGHPATVYKSGLILLLGILTLPLVLWWVAKYIVPFYRNTVGMSAYEYLGQRFGLGGRVYASLGFLADRLFDIGVTIITTSIAIQVMTGWDLRATILGLGIFTVLYTMTGGMTAVVWTSVAQGFIFVAAAFLILGRLIFAPEAGPVGSVVVEAWQGNRFNLGDFTLSWESLRSENTTQWLFILAFVTNWGRRYIADQHMVQRYLIARSDKEASRGAIINALLCVPIYAIFMLIGACLFGYYQLTQQTAPAIDDSIVPHFIVTHMPAGIIGIILAAIMAASMSSISADLSSVGTVLSTDYIERIWPSKSERTQLLKGKIMVVLGGLVATQVAILLVPEEGIASIMERMVTIAAILSGGTLGLFFLGFLTRRATRVGCYTGIAACLLFTGWGILTEPTNRILDLGAFNFDLNPILIGIFGHFILFGVGYVTSLLAGGYRPENVERFTFRRSSMSNA